MFPIHDMMNVVPASLHIMLGITLNLYNLLLDLCQHLDGFESNEAKINKPKLSDDYEEASLHVAELEESKRVHAVDIIVLMNRLHRLEAVMDNDHDENL